MTPPPGTHTAAPALRPPPAGRVSVRHFAAQTSSVPDARRHTAARARAWGVDDVAETAELLVSELTGNAVEASRHQDGDATPGRRGRIALRLTCTDTALVVEVWDDAAAVPVRRAQNLDAENGRGLLLVETLSQDRGYYRPATGGKVVWCTLALTVSPFSSAGRHDAGQPCPLPRRDAKAVALSGPESDRLTAMEDDLPLLQRVIDGLRALDSWHLPGDADWEEPIGSVRSGARR